MDIELHTLLEGGKKKVNSKEVYINIYCILISSQLQPMIEEIS